MQREREKEEGREEAEGSGGEKQGRREEGKGGNRRERKGEERKILSKFLRHQLKHNYLVYT